MIQSMEILQLSLLQLEERIDLELEKNPLLEFDAELPDRESNEYDDSENAATEGETATTFEREPEITIKDSYDANEDFQIADDFARAYSDTIDELPARSQNWLEDQDERRNDAFANIPSPSQTLQDYLTEQLGWFDLSAPLRTMAERIINNLDPNGYFPFEWDEFLGEKTTPSERELAIRALGLVRKLDPPGVGGKDLKDCLLLQLRSDMPYVDLLRILIQSHLEDISSNRLPHIAKVTDFPLETICEAIGELRRLSPKPGAEYSGA